MTRIVLSLTCLLALSCIVFGGDDKAKAKAKAAAAFKFAEAEAEAKKISNAAPCLPYQAAKELALKQSKPLVLWVGCKDDITCKDCKIVRAEYTEAVHGIADDWQGDSTRRVILFTPKGSGLDQVMSWEKMIPKIEDLKKALGVLPKPASVPVIPSGFFINAAGELCTTGV